MGGQRDAAGSRQADPTLAPLPGVSELSSRVRVPCCSWKVLLVLLQGQGLPFPGSALSQCHRTAADSPGAKKVTFLSWILYW